MYVAVIECEPYASDDELTVAVFGVAPLSVPVPSTVPPSKNVTDPVAPVVTVAVNVTVAPTLDGFGDDTSVTVDAAWFTTCVSVAEVEDA